MRDDGAFLREAFDVRGFLLQEGQRNEQREVGVLVAGRLEHLIQHPLHVLPQRVAPRLDHHASAHGRILGEVRGTDDLLIPLGVVVLTRRRDGGAGFIAHRRLLKIGTEGARLQQILPPRGVPTCVGHQCRSQATVAMPATVMTSEPAKCRSAAPAAVMSLPCCIRKTSSAE